MPSSLVSSFPTTISQWIQKIKGTSSSIPRRSKVSVAILLVGGVSLYLYYYVHKGAGGGGAGRRQHPHAVGMQGAGAGGNNEGIGAAAAPSYSSLEDVLRHKKHAGWTVSIDLSALCATTQTNESSEVDGNEATMVISESGGTFLRELLEMKCEVFLYCQVPEASQATILDQLRPYAPLGLVRDRVLFCTTVKAHEAFTRQLEPTLLVSTRYETVSTVARHIPFVLYVSTSRSFDAPNVTMVDALQSTSHM